MNASGILRERAELADNNARKASRYVGEEDCVEAYKREAAEWRAVAELMDAAEAVCRNAALVCDEECELETAWTRLNRLIQGERDGR